jgi:hypothetical protein
MLESTWRTQPVEQPTRLQLAIREWQRQLLEKARVTHSDGREPTGATTVESDRRSLEVDQAAGERHRDRLGAVRDA